MRAAIASWFVLWIGAVCRPAAAQAHTPGSSDAADVRELARARFESGVRRLAAGDAPGAIVDLEEARALRETPAVHFNLGLAYRAVGRGTEAIASLERFATLAGPGAASARVAEADRMIREIRASLAHVIVRVSPADATVELDGRTLRAGASAVHDVSAGRRMFSVRREGHRSLARAVVLRAGATVELEFRLARDDEAARLIVETTDVHARIEVDDFEVGTGRASVELPPGRHAVAVSFPGGAVERRGVSLSPRGVTTLSVERGAARGGSVPAWVYVLIGVGAAAAIAIPTAALWPRSIEPLRPVGFVGPFEIGGSP